MYIKQILIRNIFLIFLIENATMMTKKYMYLQGISSYFLAKLYVSRKQKVLILYKICSNMIKFV